MSLYSYAGLPDINYILIEGDYDRFPCFVDIDTRLEWIERFAPYRDARAYIRNHFDEFAEIRDRDLGRRLYGKIQGVLELLQQHRGVELLKIKDEYEKLYMAYLEEENEEMGFKTLWDLVEEEGVEIRFPVVEELMLQEKSRDMVIVSYRKSFGVIKRSYLELFRDEGDDATHVVPLRELTLQDVMDIPMDVRHMNLTSRQIIDQILVLFLQSPRGSTSDTEEHSECQPRSDSPLT
jgi:hypothetical protein